MIWSSAFEDSEWCLGEYATLESKEKAKTGFRYVIAKLDTSPLPALAGKLLKDMGYHKVYNLGGFKDWVEAGGKVDK